MNALLKRKVRGEDEEWERAAWIVAYLLQPHSRRKINPERLLDWRKQSNNVPEMSRRETVKQIWARVEALRAQQASE